MAFLIDSHILLWTVANSKKLKPEASAILKDPKNKIYVSTASLWELTIKQKKGKINRPFDLQSILDELEFEELPITKKYLPALKDLPLLHGDPFDRMIIAQAKTEKIPLITRDKLIEQYDLDLIQG